MAPLAAAPPFFKPAFAPCRSSHSRRPLPFFQLGIPTKIVPRWRQSTSISLLARASNIFGFSSSSDDTDGYQMSSPIPPGESYVGLFVEMLNLDKDPLDREQAVLTLWKYSQGGKHCIDEIMKFRECIILIIRLLRSDSDLTREAAAGLLRNISSVNVYMESVVASGVIEEIVGLLHQSDLSPELSF